MRTLAILTILTLSSLLGFGCSGDDDARADAEPQLAKSSGGESRGTAITRGRVAAPLPEAGPRANYPEGHEIGSTRPIDGDGLHPFDDPFGVDPDDPMVDTTDVAGTTDAPGTQERTASSQDARPCLGDLNGDLRVDVTDVYDGAAIIVTSRTASRDEIYRRAAVLAEAQAIASEASADPDGQRATAKPGEQPRAVAEPLDMPPAEVRVVELARGVRLHYIARDTEHDVIELRNAVRRVASSLEQGVCPGL